MRRRTSLHRWHCSVLWSIGWLAAFAHLPSARAQGQSLEYAIEATYIYKFAPFVDWPSPATEFPDGAFTLCVIGGDQLGTALDRAVSSQQVAGHPIVVRRYVSVSRNPGCAVMYVTGPAARVAAVLVAVRGTSVLTVTDGATDPAATGIINFVIVDDHVRFAIDNRAAEANGLTISSKLLSLAVQATGVSR